MSSAITNAGEALLALHQNLETPLVIDKFIVANVPGLDPTVAVDRTEGKPGAEYVVHEYTIPAENKGYINPNQVVYSMLLGSDIGDFDFNWIGLYSSADDAVIAITYCPTLNKKKTAHPVMGNAITRNFMLEYSGVQGVTNITVEASTWQIDFTARLKGIDERERLSNRDIYGPACFFGDGYLVIDDAGAFKLQPGLAYVEGIRIELDTLQEITPPALPAEVFLDVALQSQGSDRVAVASVVYADPGDYMDGTNGKHYGQKIADIAVDRTITDFRPKTLAGELGGVVAGKAHNHPEYETIEANNVSYSGEQAGLIGTQDVEAALHALIGRTTIPTEAEAKNGINDIGKMTPLRTAQARGATGQWQGNNASTGYTVMPNGLILQWGNTIASPSSSIVTFPLAFPNSCCSVVASLGKDYGTLGNEAVTTHSYTLTQFTVRAEIGSGVSPNVYWFAIGY
ncbi:MAG: hypothetical protein CL942_08240 [Desulfovibrio sp.]|nr:hypothetical protein [Desulfovibrio sp.]|tara:strand:- start:4105 stop:5472 length:1368 start_codon:yes stop_codon:yes gene_type:complete